MTATALEPRQFHSARSGVSSTKLSQLAVNALLLLLAALHLHLALTRSINWDEFWHYSLVESLARGEQLPALQTFFVRLFHWWLPGLAGDEIAHIIIARGVMAGFAAIAAYSIYLVAKRVTNHTSACLAVAAYLGAGFVLNHATSFRIDPMVAATLGGALAIAMRTRLGPVAILALGSLIALSAIFTMKFVLWLPAFVGVALWRWEEEGFDYRYLLRWFAAGAVAAVGFVLLLNAHTSLMGDPSSALSSGSVAQGAASKMFGFLHSPYIPMMKQAALFAVPMTIAVVLVPYVVWRENRTSAQRAAIACLALSVFTPLFYHNSAPYFYVFILPPIAIAAAFSFAFLAKRYSPAMLAGAIAFFSLLNWAGNEQPVTDQQRALLTAVHTTFDEPVAYFDCCAMIGRFEQVNGFLTPWGLEGYRNAGIARFTLEMKKQPVPLILDNEQMFKPLFENRGTSVLNPEDDASLRNNYRHFWGDLYIAGREIETGETVIWNNLVPGPYTSSHDLVVSGKALEPGGIINLPRGAIEISNASENTATLTWGRNITPPITPPPSDYWGGF